MSMRTLVFALASLIAVGAAPLASYADTLLPGQPGADTSLGQELRSQPYTDAERQAILAERQQQAQNIDIDDVTGRHG